MHLWEDRFHDRRPDRFMFVLQARALRPQMDGRKKCPDKQLCLSHNSASETTPQRQQINTQTLSATLLFSGLSAASRHAFKLLISQTFKSNKTCCLVVSKDSNHRSILSTCKRSVASVWAQSRSCVLLFGCCCVLLQDSLRHCNRLSCVCVCR